MSFRRIAPVLLKSVPTFNEGLLSKHSRLTGSSSSLSFRFQPSRNASVSTPSRSFSVSSTSRFQDDLKSFQHAAKKALSEEKSQYRSICPKVSTPLTPLTLCAKRLNLNFSFSAPPSRFYSTASTASTASSASSAPLVQVPLVETTNETVFGTNISSGVKWWMAICAAMVFSMIVIGGITRLTESGLSIVEWNPINGIIPPITEDDWIEEFDKYKQFPEFERMNKNMTLDEFKRIFFWEYFHRLWGRMIGITFALPFAYFSLRGRLPPMLAKRCGLLLGGICANGVLGWYMVKSGLEKKDEDDRSVVRVSQYRLASHFITAVTLYCGMFWTAMQLWLPHTVFNNKSRSGSAKELADRFLPVLRVRNLKLLSLIYLTAFSGSFVAGLDAGLVYNEFPLMGGNVVPEGSWEPDQINWKDTFTETEHKDLPRNLSLATSLPLGPWIRKNFFEDSASVQFNHRVLGITTTAAITTFVYSSRHILRILPLPVQVASYSLLGVVYLQATLGITTLLTFVPVHTAATHQAGSITLLSAALWLLQELRRIR